MFRKCISALYNISSQPPISCESIGEKTKALLILNQSKRTHHNVLAN